MRAMENPATAFWGLSISDADFAKLKRGVRARDMDDKWVFIAMTDEELADKETTEATTDEVPTGQETIEEELEEEPTTPLFDEALLHQAGDISIRRTWTNWELYRLAIKPSDGSTSAKIESITWEQNQGTHTSEEQAKVDAVLLCRSIAECDLTEAPDYDPSQFSDSIPKIAVDSTTIVNGTN
ncbi:hypothetical protein M406DRAFT_354853 [Cryphonectria parasitica EP155]|uniref:Uncharacterized protein n=1 Tax=Cryphonectria parasitica (strain ATCC 38755 / EP155) TaxID=660469 RepID=A0A9P4YEJ0_CRYP1|nr:uncharacterized protein M406DRAFT_354853 [Cryphonectria parasitica EP155]KAF3771416.1 hypothetical protein M406DRAFT_354853 [Cryphonectria parasitica EP155]